MADNVWENNLLDNDGSNPANWSLGSLSSSDTLQFQASTTSADCIFSANVNCRGFRVHSNYSGTIDGNGYDVAVGVGQLRWTSNAGPDLLMGGGAWTCASDVTFNANMSLEQQGSTFTVSGTNTLSIARRLESIILNGTHTLTSLTSQGNLGDITLNGTLTTNVDLTCASLLAQSGSTLNIAGDVFRSAVGDVVFAAGSILGVLDGATLLAGGSLIFNGQALSASSTWEARSRAGDIQFNDAGSVEFCDCSSNGLLPVYADGWTDGGNNQNIIFAAGPAAQPIITTVINKAQAICFANSTDYNSTHSGITRTAQLDLTSLGAGEARQGDLITIPQAMAEAYRLHLAIEFLTAPVKWDHLTVHWGRASKSGGTLPGGMSGSDSLYTGTPGATLEESLLALEDLARIEVTTDATPVVHYNVEHIWAELLGEFGAPVVVNNGPDLKGDAIKMMLALIPITEVAISG